ncbi:hypothetical protein PENTCL1PPCAC_17407 [Pristionchus entomophagus]|uniref:Uncharacterized protein n=1 Tax=Pristionchus entomophagus TaxID=358040 RepID=A0AAV5TLI8_9BILA|nr:hypothetical protein PENTCL1PPCAC_17407 [Pristionchus entomophagus]
MVLSWKCVLLVVSMAFLIDSLCFGGGGGGGCGCGRRRKREVDSQSDAPVDPTCSSSQLRPVMERNMAFSADESRIALSRTLESDGDKFLVVCNEEGDTTNRSFPLISTHYDIPYCSARRNGHRCLAFVLMNLWS